MRGLLGVSVVWCGIWLGVAGCEADPLDAPGGDGSAGPGFDLEEGLQRAHGKSLEEGNDYSGWGPWQPWIVSDLDYIPGNNQGPIHCQVGEVRRHSRNPASGKQCHIQIRPGGAGTAWEAATCNFGWSIFTESCAGAFLDPQESSCTFPNGRVMDWNSPLHLTGTDGGCEIGEGLDENGILDVKCEARCEDVATTEHPHMPVDLMKVLERRYPNAGLPAGVTLEVERPLGSIHFDKSNSFCPGCGQCWSLQIPGTGEPFALDLCGWIPDPSDPLQVVFDRQTVEFGPFPHVDDGELEPIDYDPVVDLLVEGYLPCD